MVTHHSILLSFAVNPKKDSENTPVKGGTVADLGKANAQHPPAPPPLRFIVKFCLQANRVNIFKSLKFKRNL